MGEQTIIHGRISVSNNLDKATAFINTLKNDDHFPWIRPEMFSAGSSETPYYYDEPILSFGASYKGMEHELKSYIIKFEYLLENIEFYSARFQMETEFFGTYNFFWKRKNQGDNFDSKENLFETKRWYFGLGNRSMWGTLNNSYSEIDIPPFDFAYPILSNDRDIRTSEKIVAAIQNLELDKKVFIHDAIKVKDDKNLIFPVLNFFEVRKEIKYGHEPKKGFWLMRRQKQLTSISSI